MNVRTAAVAVLAGCGRIAFDPLGGTGASDASSDSSSLSDAGGDATDATQAACADVQCISTVVTMMCNGRCFSYCAQFLAQDEANTRCLNWGGTLLVTENAADLACALTLPTQAESFWIGYMQLTGSSTPAANWIWLDSVQVWPAPTWGTGEPDDFDGAENEQAQCATMSPADGTTYDVACTNVGRFMCSK